MSANFTLEADYHEAQGRRDTMEDTHSVISDAVSREEFGLGDVGKKVAFYGVFDGHGGVRCSP
jgi:serine/threonine protein phosphatase PrpC